MRGLKEFLKFNVSLTFEIFSRKVVMSLEQRKLVYTKVHDPNFNGAFFRSLTGVLYQNQQNFNGTRNLIAKEKFLTIPVVIYVRKKFYLLQSLNDRIWQLNAGGLLDYWHSQIIDSRYLNIIESQEPTAIELHHLSGCFMLLLFGLIIAAAAFVCEVLYKRFWDRSRKLKSIKNYALKL